MMEATWEVMQTLGETSVDELRISVKISFFTVTSSWLVTEYLASEATINVNHAVQV